MRFFLSGSLAYDHIMDFPDAFEKHILPEKIHTLSVSFMVRTLRVNYGGTVGNLAYGLASLGIRPTILATAGNDFTTYARWLRTHGVSTASIALDRTTKTAAAYIMTDVRDNQITGFYPGAMQRTYPKSLETIVRSPLQSLLVLSAGNPTDMVRFARQANRKRIPYLFDPGQQLPQFSATQLRTFLHGAAGVALNDYETALVAKRTGLTPSRLLKRGLVFFITTLGPKGSHLHTAQGTVRIAVVPPKKLVDPTGAGDAYRAGLLAGIGKGYDLTTAARLGSTLAAYAVERYGTQTYTVTWPSLTRRYHRTFGRLPAPSTPSIR